MPKKAIPAAAPSPVERIHAPMTVSKVDVIMAYHSVFSTPEGSIVLADLMRHFAFNLSSMFDPNSKDPTGLLHYREGSRSVLIHIGRRMETDPASIEATESTER